MAGLSFHDRLHIQKMLAQQGYLQAIFSELIRKASPDISKMALTGKPNVWLRNVRIESNIDKYLNDFADELSQHVYGLQSDAWARATLKSDDTVRAYIKGMAINSTATQGMFNRNADAFKAFANRTKNGITLSDQIWDIATETKKQFEFYVGSGISEGRSAARISQDIRQLLNDPDTQFRRKRDENGRLIPSRPMKDYHPGQGVYKSPYKNAMRLAVTETNMAYRTADYERWNQLDFVVGWKVSRSGNGEPCKICDQLVGVYPKQFKFVGWHPNCKCFAVPELLDQDDFLEYQLTDKIPESAIITSIPKQAEEYINKVAPKVENWKSKPYWITDNYVNGDVSKGFSFKVGLPQAPVIKPGVTNANNRVKEIRGLSSVIKAKTIYNEVFGKQINVSGKGIKEWLNQPHTHYQEKNELLLDIDEVIKNSTYLGEVENFKGVYELRVSHIFEIEINGDKSYIVVREYDGGQINLHSIADSDKILKGIKKKKHK